MCDHLYGSMCALYQFWHHRASKMLDGMTGRPQDYTHPAFASDYSGCSILKAQTVVFMSCGSTQTTTIGRFNIT